MSTLDTSLVASYDLDEATAATRVDTKNGHDLTDHNSVAQVSGATGNAAGFTAASSMYLSAADHADLSFGPKDWSVAGWFYLTDKNAAYVMIGKDEAVGGRDFLLYYDNSGDRFIALVFDTITNAQTVTANNFGSPTAATWYVIAVTFTNNANPALCVITISVNAGTRDSTTTTTWPAAPNDGTAEFDVGRRSYVGFPNYFNGRVQALNKWDKVLSTSEETEFYNSGTPLFYPFTPSGIAIPVLTRQYRERWS